MKHVIIIFMFFSSFSFAQKVKFWDIPIQSINFSKFFETERKDTLLTYTTAFSISEFITLKQYKLFLNDVKVDTFNQFSESLLIDSSICSSTCYNKYISNKKFDDYPVIGVSWQSAMKYCKYLTLKDNLSDSIKFIYRLPSILEWGAALNFLGKTSDQNKLYSDWTLNAFEEATYNFEKTQTIYQYHYYLTGVTFDYKTPKYPLCSSTSYNFTDNSLKRKRIIGQSFDHQAETLEYSYRNKYAYSYIGYKDLSFRLIKVEASDFLFNETLKYWGLE